MAISQKTMSSLRARTVYYLLLFFTGTQQRVLYIKGILYLSDEEMRLKIKIMMPQIYCH